MIKTCDLHLPDWIKRQASLGFKEGNIIPTLDDMFWSMLKNSCPLIFESYAIILHPFAINWRSKELVESGLIPRNINTDKPIETEGFEQVSWKDFFRHYGLAFELKTAYKAQNELTKSIAKLGWPVYLRAPAEGSYELEELQFIIDQIMRVYGDQQVNYFYIFMQSKKWDTGDYFYIGKLSEFSKLKEDQDNREGITPTAIYPDTKEWCIISEFDCPFTYVGGSKELIDKITKIDGLEIFELTPMPII